MRRTLHEPAPGILVVAAMWRANFDETLALGELERGFGPLGQRTAVFEVTQTSYYAREMGEGLRKLFVAIEGEAARDSLVHWKRVAVALEEKHLDSDARRLNVDPMVVSLENVTVATSKGHPHRVYLRDGVFADVQLARRRGGFEALPWTYADYAERVLFFGQLHGRLPRP
ncbi:MAG: DUF4416 family protein [Deltaproteobacteria bacterium]|nr:DUF4416 family protein [Deltaproteobacteria bacterium]